MPGADGDDGVGAQHGGALGPARQRVAAAELLGLPRPVRLERVGRRDVRDVVQQPAPGARPCWRTRCASGRGRSRRWPRPSTGRCTAPAARRCAPASRGSGEWAVAPSLVPPKEWTSTSHRRRSSRTRYSTWTPGAAVHLRRPLAGQDTDSQGAAHGPDRSGPDGGMRSAPRVLAIVLAGGEGKRLAPLTADRAKPAVPFGGQYRLVDFVLSNLVNAGYLRIVVLTQYKSHSLDRHITTTWRMSTLLGNYVTPVPAQQRLGPQWFRGSADAIHQSLNLVYDDEPDYVVVFGADHVYRMDPRRWSRSTSPAAPASPSRASGCRGRSPTSSASSTGPADGTIQAVPGEADRPARPARLARRGASPRWATTSSRPRRCSRRSRSTPATRAPSTTWAATSSR